MAAIRDLYHSLEFAFDTLSYARHLKQNGVPEAQADAHAEAARQFIMAELVTQTDLEREATGLRDLDVLRRELEGQIERTSMETIMAIGTLNVVAVGALAALLKLA